MSTTTPTEHLPAAELPGTVPGARLTAYQGSAAIRAVGHELSHLDRLAAVTDGRGRSAWLEELHADPAPVVVTVGMHGRLVGYALGTSGHGITELTRLVVAPAVREHHPEVLGALVDAFVDLTATPWADIHVDPASPALAHLLATGWRPTAHPAGAAPSGVRLTAAG